MPPLPPSREVKVMVDFELSGSDFEKNSPLSLAVVAFQPSRRADTTVESCILEEKQWHIQMIEGTVMDENTKKNFWDVHEGLLEKMQEGARPIREVMAQVASLLERLSASYDLTFVAKPSHIDLGWLQYLLCKYAPDSAVRVSHRSECLVTKLKNVQAAYHYAPTEFESLLKSNRARNKLPTEPPHIPLLDCKLQIADYLYINSIFSAAASADPSTRIKVVPMGYGYGY